MFEKEAEEILSKHCDCELLSECMEGIRIRCSDFEEKKKLLLEGIEFAYNKANEWHYVENGDLPRKSMPVLAYFKGEDVSLVECTYIPDEGFKHPVFSEWYKPTAWIEKEIVLPERCE